MTRLEEIEQQRSALFRQLDTLSAEKHSLLMNKHGVEIGMLVTHKGKIYKISRVRSFDFSTPWLCGNLKTKSGDFSKKDTLLYDEWTKVRYS